MRAVVSVVIVPEFQAVREHVLLVVLGANPGHDASYGLGVRQHPVPIQPHYGRCVVAQLAPCDKTLTSVSSFERERKRSISERY